MGREVWGGCGGRGRGRRGTWGPRFPYSPAPGAPVALLCHCIFASRHPEPTMQTGVLPQGTAVHKPEPPTFGFPKNLGGEIVGGVGVGGNLHGWISGTHFP